MFTGVGNWVRGSEVAESAGRAAKSASVVGKALRSAAVAYPIGAVYGYGASENDLRRKESFQDARSSGRMVALVGTAAPVFGAAIRSVKRSRIPENVKNLVCRAVGIVSPDPKSPARDGAPFPDAEPKPPAATRFPVRA